MPTDTSEYHWQELEIASDPRDSRRAIPRVEERHRRILDVGCGAGQTLIGCQLKDGVVAVGLDTDRSAVALAREVTNTVRFVIGTGESLPFANGAFDLVICRVALPYMHVERALSEMARVLAAGGDVWLVLHPFSMTAREFRANLAGLQLKGGVYRTWVLLNGLVLHVLGRQWRFLGRNETWQSERGIERALRAAGFEQIQIARDGHFIVNATKSSLDRH